MFRAEGQKPYVCEKCGNLEFRWPGRSGNQRKKCHAKGCGGTLKESVSEPDQAEPVRQGQEASGDGDPDAGRGG